VIGARQSLVVLVILLLPSCATVQRAQTVAPLPEYVDSSRCADCHRAIYETYRRTGMGRSFSETHSAPQIEKYSKRNTFYHAASDRYYVMTERGGQFFLQRYQKDRSGKVINILEERADYVIGSGNHARTYLHRTEQNKLVELPVAWYSENGGYWGMNPGYDWERHSDFRRKITNECIFCHAAYPATKKDSDRNDMEAAVTASTPLQPIDCQRCHGPGGSHVRAPAASNIVNPARLSVERSLEICMQCHLETTSTPLPYAIRRFNRGVFSYKPGEPLGDYMIHFDNAVGTGHDDKFEIAGAAYRLRRSRCFQESAGSMTCTTCHDPHNVPRGQQAAAHYTAVCRRCHEAAITRLGAAKKHPAADDCLGCHMPKRRTDDAVHVVMTDHYIQRRRPSRNLLAPLLEHHGDDERMYKGSVVLYYPSELARSTETELYLAVAQVTANSNLRAGIQTLGALIEENRPAPGEFYFELAKAYAAQNDFDNAIPWYEKAVERLPDYWPGLHRLGLALSRSGKPERAVEFMERAALHSTDVTVLNDLALVYRRLGQLDSAISTLRQAAEMDPAQPPVYTNLGGMLEEAGDLEGAEAAFREAIRWQPDLFAAHFNLGSLLLGQGRKGEAMEHLQVAAKSPDANLKRLALDIMRRW